MPTHHSTRVFVRGAVRLAIALIGIGALLGGHAVGWW